MGGYSSEYQISITSGNVVFQNLDRKKFEPYRLLILKDRWVYLDEKNEEYPIDKSDFSINYQGKKICF